MVSLFENYRIHKETYPDGSKKVEGGEFFDPKVGGSCGGWWWPLPSKLLHFNADCNGKLCDIVQMYGLCSVHRSPSRDWDFGNRGPPTKIEVSCNIQAFFWQMKCREHASLHALSEEMPWEDGTAWFSYDCKMEVHHQIAPLPPMLNHRFLRVADRPQ